MDEIPFVRHHRDVEGSRLHWVELGGSTAKPPVVLLHGLNDSHLTWRKIAPRLARDRRVLVPDLPGHGLSGRPDASYKLHWYAHVMARWFDALALDRADVIGHSFGGGVALVMLLEPERIRRLVLVSSGGLGREIAVAFRLASIPHVVERFGQPFMGVGTRLALKATSHGVSEGEIAQLAAMNAQSGSARAFARTVRDIIDWRGQRHNFFKRANELGALPAIAAFWGERDRIIPSSHARVTTRTTTNPGHSSKPRSTSWTTRPFFARACVTFAARTNSCRRRWCGSAGARCRRCGMRCKACCGPALQGRRAITAANGK
jgi:pimeloyl-ACP methyl ester carboxylesterase